MILIRHNYNFIDVGHRIYHNIDNAKPYIKQLLAANNNFDIEEDGKIIATGAGGVLYATIKPFVGKPVKI